MSLRASSAARSSAARSSPPAPSAERLASSTVGATPPGVATVMSTPASPNTRIGSTNSSAQNPVG